MVSPEGGLCNNNSSRHDKREHVQPYRPYTSEDYTASIRSGADWLEGRGEWSMTGVGGVVRGPADVWVTVSGGGCQKRGGWEVVQKEQERL